MGKSHILTIDGWHPSTLNRLLGCHWGKRSRLKRSDREMIGWSARLAGTPPATGRRCVSLLLTLAPRQRAGDPDAYWKSILDGLVHAGLLLDDNRQNVELGAVVFGRGKTRATTIRLVDQDDNKQPR
jgi:hypothetical protein